MSNWVRSTPSRTGAAREVWEECGARVVVRGLIALYSVPAVNQIHMWFAADWGGAEELFEPGAETLETALVTADEVDWDGLAFPSGRLALEHALSPSLLPTLLGYANEGWPDRWRTSDDAGESDKLAVLPTDCRAIYEELK